MRTAGPNPGQEQQISLALCEMAHPTLKNSGRVRPVAAGEGRQEAGLVAGAGGLSSLKEGARCCFYS